MLFVRDSSRNSASRIDFTIFPTAQLWAFEEPTEPNRWCRMNELPSTAFRCRKRLSYQSAIRQKSKKVDEPGRYFRATSLRRDHYRFLRAPPVEGRRAAVRHVVQLVLNRPDASSSVARGIGGQQAALFHGNQRSLHQRSAYCEFRMKEDNTEQIRLLPV